VVEGIQETTALQARLTVFEDNVDRDILPAFKMKGGVLAIYENYPAGF